MPSSEHPKVVVIGVDSADFGVTESLMQQGLLPNLKALASSLFARLGSTIPPNTAPSWTSMFTAVNPGKHGIFFFRNLDDGRLLSSSDVQVPYIWEMFGSQARSVVVNVPLTYPVQRINGIMISGLHATKASSASVYPEVLIPEVKSKYAFDVWDVEWTKSFATDPSRTLTGLWDGDRLRTEFFLEKIETEVWDFGCLVLTSLDRIQHSFWASDGRKGRSGLSPEVVQAYRFIDDMIGMIIQRLSNFQILSVMVVSDHGFEEKRLVLYPNAYLKKSGFLKTKDTSSMIDGMISRTYNKTIGFLPTRLAVDLDRLGGPLVNKLLSRTELPPVDFNSTLAYSFPYGMIRVSKKLPDANSNEDWWHDRLKQIQEIIITNLYKDTGRDFRVVAASQVYTGSATANGPDLILLPESEVEITTAVNVPRGMNTPLGDHSMNGILLSNLAESLRETMPQVPDIGATVLALLGFELPVNVDGKCLIQPCANSTKQPLRNAGARRSTIRSFTDAEESEIQRRLNQLGYL